MKTLMHAVAAILTIFLLFLQPRSALAAVYYKRFGLGRKFWQVGDTTKCSTQVDDCIASTTSNRQASCDAPKYKKDPEIHVDNECIGQHPFD